MGTSGYSLLTLVKAKEDWVHGRFPKMSTAARSRLARTLVEADECAKTEHEDEELDLNAYKDKQMLLENIAVKADEIRSKRERLNKLVNEDERPETAKKAHADRMEKHAENAMSFNVGPAISQKKKNKIDDEHIDYNDPNQNGQTKLHLAVAANDYKLVVSLVEQGANPNVIDHSYMTPYQVAIYQDFETIQVFLKPLTI